MSRKITSLFILLFMTAAAFAQPSIKDTLTADLWLTAGLFPGGARESTVDPLYEHGGFGGITPREGMTHHSFLANHGIVTWQPDTMEAGGAISITHPGAEPSWQDWRNYKGRTFTRGTNYAYTTIAVAERSRALVVARGISAFRLNGQPFAGDFYSDDYLKVPVVLEPGTNDVLLRLSGSPSSSGTFMLIPLENDIQLITDDITAPHLVRGSQLSTLHLGLPLVNHTNQWQEGVEVEVFGVVNGRRSSLSRKTIPAMGPLAYQVTAHAPDLSALSWQQLEGQQRMPLEIEVRKGSDTWTFASQLDISEREEPFNVTFLDSDHSVQYYSVVPPKDLDPTREYPAIFFLHGASVKVKGYNGFTQKDWAYVIAPTNRRRFGFDWEKQGKVNALNTLAHAIKEFQLDASRIYLSGHSMGAHGSWVLSTSHPHLFAAVGPSAGWTSFDIYTPFVSRMDHLAGSPGNMHLLYSVLQPTRTLSLAENLNNLPVYILHGGADESVPADHARMFFQRLSQLGYQVTYNEVPGKAHWWNDKETPGAECVNHEELMTFFQGRQREEAPRRIRYRTAGLAESHQAYWVKVLQRNNFIDDTRVHADVQTRNNGDLVNIRTFNVRRLQVDLLQAPVDAATARLVVNGKEVPVTRDLMTIELEEATQAGLFNQPLYEKSPEQAGPIKQVFYEPFALVYATRGGEEWERQTYAQARQLAQSWYYRGNGRTIIVPDTLVDPRLEEQYNLVLLGSPESNAYYAKINGQLPLRVFPGTVELGDSYGDYREYDRDLAVKFIHPNPRNPRRLVQINGGATLRAQALSMQPAMISSADGLPDYLVFDEGVITLGFAALINAGYFNNDWRYDEENAFVQPDFSGLAD